MTEKITDTGVVLPHAHKHREHTKTFKASKSDVTLKSLWPQPDWKELISSGKDPVVVAKTFGLYKSLRTKPRTANHGSKITTAMWKEGYIQSIPIIRSEVESFTTAKDFSHLNERIAKRLGFQRFNDVYDKELTETFVFWSAGRGDRHLRPPATLSPLMSNLCKYLPELGWPDDNEAIKLGRFPIEFTDGTWAAGWLRGKSSVYRDAEVFDTREEVITFINGLIAKERKVDAPIPIKPSCLKKPRQGPVYRDNDVSAEDFITDFGFRGVQFGESMTEKEKQAWLNNGYDAFCDLAYAIGFPKKWIGLGGVGIAFGARGTGFANAHYERELRVMNFTRKNGAGSLAHEWAHAFDHRLSRSLTGSTYQYASNKAIRGHKVSQERKGSIHGVNILRQLMISITDRSSNYFNRSLNVANIKRSGDYWIKNHELFARAFETYVQHKISSSGNSSPWLSFGTMPGDYHRHEESTFPYPLPDEIDQISELFNSLFYHLSVMK